MLGVRRSRIARSRKSSGLNYSKSLPDKQSSDCKFPALHLPGNDDPSYLSTSSTSSESYDSLDTYESYEQNYSFLTRQAASKIKERHTGIKQELISEGASAPSQEKEISNESRRLRKIKAFASRARNEKEAMKQQRHAENQAEDEQEKEKSNRSRRLRKIKAFASRAINEKEAMKQQRHAENQADDDSKSCKMDTNGIEDNEVLNDEEQVSSNSSSSGKCSKTFMDFVEHLLVEVDAANQYENSPGSSLSESLPSPEDVDKSWPARDSDQVKGKHARSGTFMGGPDPNLPKPILRRFPTGSNNASGSYDAPFVEEENCTEQQPMYTYLAAKFDNDIEETRRRAKTALQARTPSEIDF